jgi:hypothetical protein
VAKPRMRKKAAAAEAEALFETDAAAEAVVEKQIAEEEPDRRLADEMGPQPPRHVRDPRGDERAWESFPAGGQCSVCGGLQRETPGGAVCKRGHGGAPALDHAAAHRNEPRHDVPGVGSRMTTAEVADAMNAGKVPGVDGTATVVGPGAVSVAPRRRSTGVEVVRTPGATAIIISPGDAVREPLPGGDEDEIGEPSVPDEREEYEGRTNEHPADIRTRATVRLVEHTSALPLARYDLADLSVMDSEDKDLRGALVRVDAELRPSERASFDGEKVRTFLRACGARGVTIAVRPVAEASEARAEVQSALTPEAAIGAWFDALPNVPEDEREAARALALELLHAERV